MRKVFVFDMEGLAEFRDDQVMPFDELLALGRLPAQMLIDPDGLLRQVHYGHSMTDIPTTDETLAPLTESA